jgi:hypothetical protein
MPQNKPSQNLNLWEELMMAYVVVIKLPETMNY